MTRRTPGTAQAAVSSIAPMRARATGERDQLDVEDVVERDIGDVGLAAGHPVEATDPWRARPDDLAHCGATWASGVEATSVVTACGCAAGSATAPRVAASSTASMICS